MLTLQPSSNASMVVEAPLGQQVSSKLPLQEVPPLSKSEVEIATRKEQLSRLRGGCGCVCTGLAGLGDIVMSIICCPCKTLSGCWCADQVLTKEEAAVTTPSLYVVLSTKVGTGKNQYRCMLTDLRSKHVKLTQACYPKGKAAVARPNSSELQYLAYYASSRPKKLIKVGAYVRQKTSKDVYWNRETDVIVSLEMLTFLIEKCHANLSLFGTDVLLILRSSLEMKSVQVIEHVRTCFVMFAKYHDGTALGTDVLYTKSYENLLEHFSKMVYGQALIDHETMQLLGIECIYAAYSSSALQASDLHRQLDLALPAILSITSSVKEESIYGICQHISRHLAEPLTRNPSLLSNGTVAHHSSSWPFDDIPRTTTELVQLRAFDILRLLFDTNDATQIRYTTAQILKQLDSRSASRVTWVTVLVQIVAEWSPINLRFHILGACVSQLELISVTAGIAALHTDLLHVIHGLLASRVNLIGLSTIDILDSLLTLGSTLTHSLDDDMIRKTIEDLSSHSTTPASRRSESSYTTLLHDLSRAAVAITTHSYYNEQGLDMFSHILQRTSASDPINPRNILQKLFYLDTAIRLIQQLYSKRDTRETDQSIPLETMNTTLNLLTHSSIEVRTKYVQLYCMLLVFPSEQDGKIATTGHSDIPAPTITNLQTAIYRNIQDFSTSTEDLALCGQLFNSALRVLPPSQILTFLPMLCRIDEEANESKKSTSRTNQANYIVVEQFLRSMLNAVLVALGKAQCIQELLQHENLQNQGCSLPPLSHILARIGNEEQIGTGSLDHAVLTWSPSELSGNVGQELSIKQSTRSNLGSTATHSRLGPEHIMPPPSKAQASDSFIAGLRNELLNTTASPSPMFSGTTTGRSNVDDLFDGIELQPVCIDRASHENDSQTGPSPGATPSSVGGTQGRAMPHGSKQTIVNGDTVHGPAMRNSEASTARSLGKVVA